MVIDNNTRPSNSAERLKQIMQMRGLKQVDIIEKCKPFCSLYNEKMSKSTLSQYISGKYEPDQGKLFILGLALNVSEAWLMGFDTPMERTPREPVPTLTLPEVRAWISTASKEEKVEVMTAILDSSPKEEKKEFLNVLLEILMK